MKKIVSVVLAVCTLFCVFAFPVGALDLKPGGSDIGIMSTYINTTTTIFQISSGGKGSVYVDYIGYPELVRVKATVQYSYYNGYTWLQLENGAQSYTMYGKTGWHSFTKQLSQHTQYKVAIKFFCYDKNDNFDIVTYNKYATYY